jgi:hypothetical protein
MGWDGMMPDNIRGENQSYSAIGQALNVYFILEPHLMHHLLLPEAVLPPIAWLRGGVYPMFVADWCTIVG